MIAAALKGHMEMVRCLCEHGAKVNLADSEGQIPLHYAARAGNEDEQMSTKKTVRNARH